MPSKRSRLISLDERTEAILANEVNASALIRRLLVSHAEGRELQSAHLAALIRKRNHLESVLLAIYNATTHPDTPIHRLRMIQQLVLEEIDLPEYKIRREV